MLDKTITSNIIKETCDALWEFLNTVYLKTPSTADEWLRVADEAEWNLTHVLGAADGKHVDCLKFGGSMQYNYKGFHSTVIMAICDAKLKFIYVEYSVKEYQDNIKSFVNSEAGSLSWQLDHIKSTGRRRVEDEQC